MVLRRQQMEDIRRHDETKHDLAVLKATLQSSSPGSGEYFCTLTLEICEISDSHSPKIGIIAGARVKAGRPQASELLNAGVIREQQPRLVVSLLRKRYIGRMGSNITEASIENDHMIELRPQLSTCLSRFPEWQENHPVSTYLQLSNTEHFPDRPTLSPRVYPSSW